MIEYSPTIEACGIVLTLAHRKQPLPLYAVQITADNIRAVCTYIEEISVGFNAIYRLAASTGTK